MSLPKKIVAGDTFSYTVTSNTYTDSDGYTVYLKFRGAGTIDITGTSSDDTTFELTETAANTRGWRAGYYKYIVYASDGTNEYTLETGAVTIELRADLDHTTDVRTHAQKVLAALEAQLEGKASKDQQSYSINGRQITRYSVEDLLKFRAMYRKEVKAEQGKVITKLFVRL